MAASQRAISVGIMAEDQSDVDVIRHILPKIRNRKFGIKKYLGGGCGNLKRKCSVWARLLRDRGCSALIMVHDLDRGNLSALRAALTEAVSPCPFAAYVIVIPVQELEAWLLADPIALQKSFCLKKAPKCPKNPERTDDPKEALRDLVWLASGKTKRYVNAIHNERIARHVSVAALRKCAAFKPLESFWKGL